MVYYTHHLLSPALKLFLVSKKNPDKTVRVPELEPWHSDPPHNERAGDRGRAQSQTAFLMDWFRMYGPCLPWDYPGRASSPMEGRDHTQTQTPHPLSPLPDAPKVQAGIRGSSRELEWEAYHAKGEMSQGGTLCPFLALPSRG